MQRGFVRKCRSSNIRKLSIACFNSSPTYTTSVRFNGSRNIFLGTTDEEREHVFTRFSLCSRGRCKSQEKNEQKKKKKHGMNNETSRCVIKLPAKHSGSFTFAQ